MYVLNPYGGKKVVSASIINDDNNVDVDDIAAPVLGIINFFPSFFNS